MIVLKIGKEEFKLPESRKEVTIRQMLQFYEQVEPLQPPSMKRIARYYQDQSKIYGRELSEAVKADKLTDLERELNEELDLLTVNEKPDQYYRYYATVLSFFSGIPEETMMRARLKDLEKFHGMLLNLINTQEPDLEFRQFEFKGETYHLPARLPVPMENGTLIEFLEAEQYKHYYAQLEETDDKDDLGFDVKSHYNALLPIVCIIARKKDEPYSDDLVNKRRELFLDLPLYDADQVFFYLAAWKAISIETTNRLSEIGSRLMTLPPVQKN